MKTIKYILFVILFATSFVSCEDELLNQTNPNAVSTENFWKTTSDFDKGVNALYGALQFTSVGGADVNYKEIMGDLAGTESWYSSPLTFANLKWTDATDFVQQRWGQLYIGIFRANQIIYYIDKTDIYTQDEKNLIIAQARFMRAFCYFNLMADYNQAIIHTTLPLTQADFSKPASSADSIRSQVIIPDLKFALSILPKQWDKSIGIGHFTWGASASLLGKTYLYAKDWTNAAKYFKDVIDSKVYSLTEDYMDNFTTEGEFNTESILEISYSDNFKKGISGYKVDDYLTVGGSEAQSYANVFSSLDVGGYNTIMPTYWLQELFVSNDQVDASNDVNIKLFSNVLNGALPVCSRRTYATIVVEHGDGLYYNSPLVDDPTTKEVEGKAHFAYGQGSKIKKYTSWYSKTTEDVTTGCRSGINIRVIRFSDVLLMYAEAVLNRDGEAGNAEAITYIDMVRSRAGVITLQKYMDDNGGDIPDLSVAKFPRGKSRFSFVTMNNASLMKHIQLVERPLELAFEGQRWNDLVRWGLVSYVFTERLKEENLLVLKLCKAGTTTIANLGGAEKVYPLYLNERVRLDIAPRAANYTSDHDYFPIPSSEKTSNNAFK